MRVITQQVYGGPEVLELVERPKPAPQAGDVLIRVLVASISYPDCAMRKADPWITRFFTGLLRPKDLTHGSDMAGVVEAVGEGVTRFRPGERVYGAVGQKGGCHADYVCVGESEALVALPDGLEPGAAAELAYGFLTAMPFLRDVGKVSAGQRVLVNGASGSVGVVAVQLAKLAGADVTGVCSGANVELVRALGADAVIDYEAADFTAVEAAYDVIFDAVGKSSFGRCKRALTARGIYMTTVPTLGIVFDMLGTRKSEGKCAAMATTGLRKAEEKRQDLEVLSELVREGKLRAVIDRRYPLERIAEAHAYAETGHKRGGVVIDVAPSVLASSGR